METFSTFTVILLVLLSTTVSFAVFFCYMKYWPERQAAPPAKDGCVILSSSQLSVSFYGGGGGLGSEQECPVCLAELEEGERVKVIPVCGHIFHPACIDRWFALSCSCPLCRCSEIPSSSSPSSVNVAGKTF